MARIDRFEDIEAWQLARALAKETYELVHAGVFGNDFRFIGQITDSIGSVMDNIAEGFERGGTREFILFLSYAKGSAGEYRSQLYRAMDATYINQQRFDDLFAKIMTISKKLGNFMEYLKKTEIKGTKFKRS